MTKTVTMREKVHAENLQRDWPEVADKLKKLRSEKARLVAALRNLLGANDMTTKAAREHRADMVANAEELLKELSE